MTRDEALRQLAGTWQFEMRRGRVRIRDARLLEAVEGLREARVAEERGRERPVPVPHEPMRG